MAFVCGVGNRLLWTRSWIWVYHDLYMSKCQFTTITLIWWVRFKSPVRAQPQ